MNSTKDLIIAKYSQDTLISDLHPKSEDLRKKFFSNKSPNDFRCALLEFLKYAHIDASSIKKDHMDSDNIHHKHNEYRWDITWFNLFGLLASNFENHPRNLLKQPSQVTITQIIEFYDKLHAGIEELPTFLKNIIQKHPSYEYSKTLCDPDMGLKKLSASCTDTYFLNLLGYSFNNISLQDLLRNIDFKNSSMANLANQKAHPYSLANVLINANLYDFLLKVLIMLFDIVEHVDLSKNCPYLMVSQNTSKKDRKDIYFNLLEEIILIKDFDILTLSIEQPPSNILNTVSDSFYYKESHKLIDNLLGLYIASFLE